MEKLHLPTEKIHSLRFGQLLYNAVSQLVPFDPSPSLSPREHEDAVNEHKAQILDRLYNMENQDLQEIVDRYIDKLTKDPSNGS
jgi:hypothetical protein